MCTVVCLVSLCGALRVLLVSLAGAQQGRPLYNRRWCGGDEPALQQPSLLCTVLCV
jgi:hypothetical protein